MFIELGKVAEELHFWASCNPSKQWRECLNMDAEKKEPQQQLSSLTWVLSRPGGLAGISYHLIPYHFLSHQPRSLPLLGKLSNIIVGRALGGFGNGKCFLNWFQSAHSLLETAHMEVSGSPFNRPGSRSSKTLT